MRVAVAVVLLLAACGGDDAVDAPDGGGLDTGDYQLPEVIALPYVVAGGGAVTVDVPIIHTGVATVGDLRWQLDGAPDFTIVAAPDQLVDGETATLTVAWTGSSTPRIAGAVLEVDSDVGTRRTVEVWAVAGDPALGSASFEPVTGAGGVVIGDSAVVSMPTAPFPSAGSPWTDDRVHLFVPTGYRDLDAQHVVLHFHGHSTTIDATVPAHRYREQVFASGANVVLAVPQGPVNAASGDFGKLDDPAGTAAFLDEVLVVLYRAGVIRRPIVGGVILTSHSGGYAAVAANLAGEPSFQINQVSLFDSLYGFSTTYRDFALSGGRLRSNYTASGGTDANNQALAASLVTAGLAVATAPTQRALREAGPIIYFTAASHGGATGDDTAYGEQLRWGSGYSRRGPRIELREAIVSGGSATVRWLSPLQDDLVGFLIETSDDGVVWSLQAEADPDDSEWSFALDQGVRVRVVPVSNRVAPADRLPSDVARIDPGADVLVVDGFDRIVDGSWGELGHDFAARVGEAAGPVHTVSNEAITEDGFDLSPYRAVIWLLGDESTADHTFTADEQSAIDAYLDGGGRIVISGSEVGFDLDRNSADAAWLAATTGAVLAADDAGATSARGAGALASLPAFSFGGAAAVYPEEFPDRFTAAAGATVLLEYSTGTPAAIGRPGRGVLVGFPLETIEDPNALAAVITALLALP